MIEMLIASVTEESQYAESRAPLDNLTNYITKKVLTDINALKGINKQEYDQIYYLSPAYQNEVKANLMAGKMNLGAFALSNSHHSLAQAVHLKFKEKLKVVSKYELTDLDKIEDNAPLYHEKTKEGKSKGIFVLISDWLSAMVNAHVDVAKDPYINRLNVRKLTLNTVNLLLRTGKGESTFYFMSQPILVDLANEYDKYSGSYGVNKTKSSIENTIIDNVFKKYVEKYDKEYTKELFDDSDGTLAQKAFDIDFLRNQMDEKTEHNSEWYKNQLEILKVYIELQPAARALSECVNVSQIDTKKFGNNFALQQKFLLKMYNFFANKTMFANAKDIISETFLKDKLIYGLLESRKQFSGMLLRTTPEFENLRASIYSYINDVAYLDEKTINNVTNMMEASYKTKIMMSIYERQNPGINKLDWIKTLLYDGNRNGVKNESVPTRFAKFKKAVYSGKYPDLLSSDGSLNNSLLENFYEQAITSKDDIVLPRKLIFTKNHTDDEHLDDHIIRAWEELLDHSAPEVRKLAEDLIYWSMFTSGDGFGKNNLFKYVPHSWRIANGYYDEISKLEKNPENLSQMIDIDSVFLNLWWNDQVIPPIEFQEPSFNEDGTVTMVAKKGMNVKYFQSKGDFLRVLANKKRVRVPKSIDLDVPEVINKSPFAVKQFRPFIKLNLGQKNNPNSTFVYKLIGYRTTENSIKGVYIFYHKRGYNYKGGVLIEPSYESNGVKANISLLVRDSSIPSNLEGLDMSNVTIYKNTFLEPNAVTDYTGDLLDYITGKIDKLKKSKTTYRNGIQYAEKSYTKDTATDNPEVDFAFTDNAEAYTFVHGLERDKYDFPNKTTPKINVGIGKNRQNQAVIRTDKNGNINSNAYGIIVKKYQKDEFGKFVKGEGQFKDNADDFELFKMLNKHSFDRLQQSENQAKVFPPKIATGKAALPLSFAKWLQKELADRFSLYYDITKNKTKGYSGYGLSRSELNKGFVQKSEDVTLNDRVYKFEDTGHTYEFQDGTVIATDFELNEQQKDALKALEDFYNNPEQTTFVLKGYAGTGKTSIMKVFDNWLTDEKHNVTPLYAALTHKANKVTQRNNPNADTTTVAAMLKMKPKNQFGVVSRENVEFQDSNDFDPVRNVIIIDECSMIKDANFDIIKRVARNRKLKIIFMGDPKQLRPPKQNNISKSFENVDASVELTKVERTGDNAILKEATAIRNNGNLSYKTEFNDKQQGVAYYNKNTKNDTDKLLSVLRNIVKSEAFNNPSYFKILAYTNYAVSVYNTNIRKIKYGENVAPFVKGEALFSYKTKYENETVTIRNSEDYVITSDVVETERAFVIPEVIISNDILKSKLQDKLNRYNITLDFTKPEMVKQYSFSVSEANTIGEKKEHAVILLDPKNTTINNIISCVISLLNEQVKNNEQLDSVLKKFVSSFETAIDIRNEEGYIMKDKLFDYGYAITIDKSQGSTYSKVFVDGTTLEADYIADDVEKVKQYQYVAISRAQNQVHYLTTHEVNNEQNTNTENSSTLTKLVKEGKEIQKLC